MALTHDGAALTILRRYCNGSHADGQELLVIKHRAEIAHVEPAFKEVKWVDCGTGGCTPRAV